METFDIDATIDFELDRAEDIARDVRETVRRIARHISNEDAAELAFGLFSDYFESESKEDAFELFRSHFPRLALYLEHV